MSRRRGLTLAELLVYVSLVSAGVLLIGGVELFAQRSLRAQQAQLEVELQVTRLGSHFRADVEAARALSLEGDVLTITAHDGARVRYGSQGRELLGADDAAPTQLEEAPAVSGCRFTLTRLESGRVRVDASFEFSSRVEGELLTRTRERTAQTRLAVSE